MEDVALWSLRIVIAIIASLTGVLIAQFMRRTLPTSRAKIAQLTLGGALIGMGVSFFIANVAGMGPSPWIGALVGAISGFFLLHANLIRKVDR